MAQTLFEKIWTEHAVVTRKDGNTLLYVDRHLIHDLHFRAFAQLKTAGHSIREPEKLFGVPDHSLPTTANRSPTFRLETGGGYRRRCASAISSTPA